MVRRVGPGVHVLTADLDRQRLVADLALVAASDRAAFHRVYEATSRKLYGVCLGISADRGAAEDVLQDAYVRVWQHAAQFDASRASPITWLCAIARNMAIDARRSGLRREERDLRAAPIDEVALPAIDAALSSAEQERRALDCLDALGDEQRSAIRQAFLGGLSYREVAERLMVPLGTMKSRIRRGLTEMRRCLGDD